MAKRSDHAESLRSALGWRAPRQPIAAGDAAYGSVTKAELEAEASAPAAPVGIRYGDD